jgi:exosortase C (VPDSG-CTERM-specific)
MNAAIPYDIGPNRAALRRQLQRLAVAAGLLGVCFGRPLLQLAAFTWHSEFFSYIPLIPIISGYLIWTNRKALNLEGVRPCWPGAALGWTAGAAVIAVYWMERRGGWQPATQDYLTLMMSALLCCFWGLCLALLGSKLSGQVLFPLAFLAFAVPMPTVWQDHIETFFQYTSAAAAEGYCHVAREPVLRDGVNLRMTAFPMVVGPECSGIHSTLVLLLTSLLADYLFLRRFWTRAVLVLFVIPLAILRNGFRVFVLGWLGVHMYPNILDTSFHHKGGPYFFALSLIPFFLLLVFLRKRDYRAGGAPPIQPQS